MFNLKIKIPRRKPKLNIQENVAGIDDSAPQQIKDIYSEVEKEFSSRKRKKYDAYKDFLENSYSISQHNRENENSRIYKKNEENKIMKVIEGSLHIEPNIVREITMQKYAYELQDKCDFSVPKIYEYGKILPDVPGANVLYYIIMEYIDAPTLRKTDRTGELKGKTESINECLKRNNLFHNDYHIENILVGENDKISVIDYGRATPNAHNPEDTILHQPEQIDFSSFGGTKRRKRRQNKKTKNKKHRK